SFKSATGTCRSSTTSPTRGKRGALMYNLQSMRSRWPEGRICPSRASSVHGSTRRIISDSFLSKGSIGQKRSEERRVGKDGRAGDWSSDVCSSDLFFQVRDGYLQILDYKPDARKERRAHVQPTIYALALARRTNLPLKSFKCAWFDAKDYFGFLPIKGVYRPEEIGRASCRERW